MSTSQPKPAAAPITGKARLEGAVTRASKAIVEVIRAVELGAVDLTAADVDKAFAALQLVVQTSHGRAGLSLTAFKGANGGFSLDAELPVPVVPAPALQVVGGPARPASNSVGGRFVREVREGALSADAPPRPAPAATDDDEEGFIED